MKKIVLVALISVLLLSAIIQAISIKPSEITKTVKTVESSDFMHVSDIHWEHEPSGASSSYETRHRMWWDFERADEWNNFACVDKDSAELVIGVRENGYAELIDLITRSGGELVNTISIGGEITAVVSDVPFVAISRFMAEARATDLPRYIELKMRFHANFVPNDPYWVLQGGLKKIEADSAWNITTGDLHVLVAIVDTGVDYNHPDLVANYVALGYDWVNDDLDPMDDHGHGTHCAGIIAAELNNSIGIAGVAQVRIMAEKGLNRYGSGWSDDLANAICHAVDHGADILSCSWGGYRKSELIHDAVKYAYEAGVLVIGSAGNNAWDLKNYPAAYKEVVAVTATDKADDPTSFTNFGDWVELAAPGSLIFSTFPDSAYRYFSGTSMSTPYVAGVAALVWSQFPNMTRDQVRQQLLKTSDDLGDPGFDVYYGYGRVNARMAVEQTPPEHDILILGWQKTCMTLYCEPGDLVIINSTIFNFGAKDQSQVTSHVLINGSIIDSKQIDFLESGRSETLRFYWTPRFEGIYNVTSYVVPVADENITGNNALSINVRVRIPKVIEVGKNNRIQNAIDAAYPGDTVRVAAGTYYEHLTLEKSLILIGGKGGSTIIDGNGTGTVVHVLADNVNVSGFTIQNGDRGICLDCSDRNTITSNTILNNSEGLILFHSGSNIITNNSMTDNECNFGVMGDFSKYIPSHFIQYMDASNTVEGKPVYYWVNQHNKQVPIDAGYVAVISSTNITVKDLNLTKNSQGVLFAYADGSVVENINASQNRQGILLVESFNNAIHVNTMINNDCGIDLLDSFNNVVSKNAVLNNIDGISLRGSSHNVVSHNMIASNDNHGIWLKYCTSNEIGSNTVLNNFEGVRLAWSGYSVLRDNNVTGNAYNFGVEGDFLSDFILDVDASNTVDGKPVYYLINRRNLVINPSTFPTIGYLAIVNCTNIAVKGLNLTNNRNGILLAYTSSSTIENVNASNNQNGIHLSNCDENTICENIITSSYNGISLHSSDRNDITRNTVISSGLSGVYLANSKNNQIKNNTVSESEWGFAIALEESSRDNRLSENTVSDNFVGVALGFNEPHGNEIYHNNFIDNTNQVFGWVRLWWRMNTWDNGKGQGNYWSDYKGEDLDGDGIGDTRLPHLGVDHHPLMTKYWNIGDVNHDGKVDIRDITVVAMAFGFKPGDENWNPIADLNGDEKIDIRDITIVALEFGKTL